ncbi:ATP synthase subunit I [Paenibacillus daejeonensis]|uniref:ATP synthase subunit I n=1 Tax=Paenibacillus daejeonensis TaxID=135193 RepID=UPI000360CDB5|nr:ATP synthase subunit I [Paenibacillus daejeonensis]
MDNLMRGATRSALFFVTGCLVAWFIVPEGRTVAAGLILGVLASLMNALLLKRRIDRLEQVIREGRPRRVGIGTGARFASVLLVALIALRFPDNFNLPAAVLASFYVQFAVLVTAFMHNLRDSRGKG